MSFFDEIRANNGEVSVREQLIEKWKPLLDAKADGVPPVNGFFKRAVVAQLLENQNFYSTTREAQSHRQTLLGEAAPTNSMGASSSTASDGSIDIFDPVLISLLRRSAPNMIHFDVMGLQPMSGPVGLIFAMRSRYDSQTGTEALFNEANTTFSASAKGNTASIAAANAANGTGQTGTDPTTRASGTGYTVEQGMSRADLERIGDGATNRINEMAFSIEKISVDAVGRALKADYSIELAQDLKAIHGLDAETELANILSNELLAALNRECVRTINYSATTGAQENVNSAGTFDLDVDSNGRWMEEKFRGLMFQVGREAAAVARATRRGRGNLVICSSDLALALEAAGKMYYPTGLDNELNVDDTGVTFAGILNKKYKVFVDPYFSSSTGKQYMTVGYKGSSPFDAGIFYCPYIPLQMMRAQDPDTFQPKIAFKTRYGIKANPFATVGADGTIGFGGNAQTANRYYRFVTVTNLM